MSNITGDESFSSEENNTGGGGEEVQQHLPRGRHQFHGQSATSEANGSVSQPAPATKKKRNLPGNPDPTAEVIALSPATLMATNRFVCEICNKGFQRDQNLQLHRRGHNLPWKLRQRPNNEVARKRVYVCPEVGCVHHNPGRALGDLTGIKKHFCRKHGEKKWKCDKCSKKYAVQSDWKAHSKTCGTREYKCDCGTIFSRRDSFITHRAFCDALTEENNKPPLPPPTAATPTIPSLNPSSDFAISLDIKQLHGREPLPSKSLTMFAGAKTATLSTTSSPSLFSLPSSSLHLTSPPPPLPSSPASHMSATALLQKAAEMGATASNNNNNRSQMAYELGMEGMNHMHFFDASGNSNGSTVDFLGVGGPRSIGMYNNINNNNNNIHQFHNQFHYQNGMHGLHQFQQQEQQGHGVIDKPMWGDVL